MCGSLLLASERIADVAVLNPTVAAAASGAILSTGLSDNRLNLWVALRVTAEQAVEVAADEVAANTVEGVAII